MTLLREMSASVARELEIALRNIGEHVLAASVGSLKVCERCPCGDRDCGTFYTRPRSETRGPERRQVTPVLNGLMAIDVVENQIVCVEFLDRADITELLDRHLGPVSAADEDE